MTNQAKTNKPNSFIFYRSFFETIGDLEDKQQLEIYKAIAEFSLNDNLINLDGISKTIFRLIQPQLLANKKRYLNGLKGAEHGIKGGRPKTQNNPLGYLETQINPTEPKKADSDSVIDKDISNKPLDNPEENPNITPKKTPNKNNNKNNNNNLNLNTNKNNNLNNKPNNKIVTVEKSDLDIFCEDVVNGFQSILEDKMQRKITTNNWQKDIKLLISKDLQPRGEEQAKQDVIKCIQAIADNWKSDYFPEVQSASAFREKFTKIENFLSRKKPLTKQQQLELDRKEQEERLLKFYSNQ